MRSAFHRCPDDPDRQQAMADGGESEGFPFGMFLRVAGGMTLTLLGVTIGLGAIASGASPPVALVGFGVTGAGLIAGTWLVGTASDGDAE